VSKPKLLENVDCVLHAVPVRTGTHDNADLNGFHVLNYYLPPRTSPNDERNC
jgi:hypothetical protein